MVQFPTTFLLLQQEGYLIQSSLLSGLHHLRNARLDTKGHFYTAFFQLSTGLERLMKATFVINFMRENQMATPTDRQLKKFGHDLTTLFDHVSTISLPGNSNPLNSISPNSIEHMVLNSLADFASGARYCNLDSLVNAQRFNDPLENWNSVIERVLIDDVRLRDLERVVAQSSMLASKLKGCSAFLGTDLMKRPLNALAALSLPRFHNLAAGHAVNHTMVLIRALAQQLDDVSHLIIIDPTLDRSEPAPVPYMHEFFDFIHYDKQQILRKRRWP